MNFHKAVNELAESLQVSKPEARSLLFISEHRAASITIDATESLGKEVQVIRNGPDRFSIVETED